MFASSAEGGRKKVKDTKVTGKKKRTGAGAGNATISSDEETRIASTSNTGGTGASAGQGSKKTKKQKVNQEKETRKGGQKVIIIHFTSFFCIL